MPTFSFKQVARDRRARVLSYRRPEVDGYLWENPPTYVGGYLVRRLPQNKSATSANRR